MKRVFIGHRGVGKSSLLQRHKEYFPAVPAFDLDLEIEKSTGKKIADIFTNEGELAFRQKERELFKRLINLENFVISVGGGFNLEHIPIEIETIFVSRRTDSDGRIFLNRPKINSQLSDLDDSLSLYQNRQQNYIKRADFIYHMPEGIKEFDQIEFQILSGASTSRVKAYLTVQKKNAQEMQHNFLELRTDIFSHAEIEQIIHQHPDKEFLVSFRSKENTQLFKIDNEKVIYDWALELGEPPEDVLGFKSIVSMHDGCLQDCIEELRLYPQAQLKLCPVIDSWEELLYGYRWQQENPTARSFLPRTGEGKSKYRWFRLLAAHFQKINFVQGFSEIDDQPSWYEFLQHADLVSFGAVLGNPIHHSRSGTEQSVLAIPLEEKDFKLALGFLTELGMNHAAVTSPLKTIAGEVNSLVLKTEKKNKQEHKFWMGTSTDQYGFKKLVDQIPIKQRDHIAVWGGSGVIAALKKEVSQAQFFSARTGLPKENSHHVDPQVIIWAAPRTPEVKMPFDVYPQWNPQTILDLNYTDNSLGIECAKKYNCNYISGLEMFLEQARYQREFWKENL